jgi:hypothetical protein
MPTDQGKWISPMTAARAIDHAASRVVEPTESCFILRQEFSFTILTQIQYLVLA